MDFATHRALTLTLCESQATDDVPSTDDKQHRTTATAQVQSAIVVTKIIILTLPPRHRALEVHEYAPYASFLIAVLHHLFL
jgi:hypothetical protein